MRVILCTTVHSAPKDLVFPDATHVLRLYEDFSVGPLQNGHDPSVFEEDRIAFWRNKQKYSLPDGSKMAYFVWLKLFPRFDLVEMVKSGVAVEDIAVPQEQKLEDLAADATSIEVWCDRSVQSQISLWYIVSMLQDLRVNSDAMIIFHFPGKPLDEKTEQFWSEMACGIDDKPIEAITPTEAYWKKLSAYWLAATQLTQDDNPVVINDSDAITRNTFSVLKGRVRDPETGLTNIERRLLQSTTTALRKTPSTVADAMIAGWDVHDHVELDTLEATLKEMSCKTPPLIEIEGDGPMMDRKSRRTSFGSAKLGIK